MVFPINAFTWYYDNLADKRCDYLLMIPTSYSGGIVC